MKIQNFPDGLTVKELKAIIKDWPETDSDGISTEVWVETGWCLSSLVIEVSPLNRRGKSADIIFSIGIYEFPYTLDTLCVEHYDNGGGCSCGKHNQPSL